MDKFSRTDTSLLGSWWWNLDKWIFASVCALCIIGLVLLFSASPEVADHIGKAPDFFIKKQAVFLPMAILTMLFFSILNEKWLKFFAMTVFISALLLMIAVIFKGYEIKGAKRWITVNGITVQPSEFIKPAFAVLCAWLLCIKETVIVTFRKYSFRIKKGYFLATPLFAVTIGMLLNQPDFGMTVTICAIFGMECFIFGIPWKAVFVLATTFAGIIGSAYVFIPHVHIRINNFFNPGEHDNYQVKVAIDAFSSGGLFGTGPGEKGIYVPDSHTDFILAIIGEQFGLFIALLVLSLYAVIFIRGIYDIYGKSNAFVIVSVCGLLTQLGFQAIVNMTSTLGLIPPKGMTLPFISYGGSSLLSTGMMMGMILSLCSVKRR